MIDRLLDGPVGRRDRLPARPLGDDHRLRWEVGRLVCGRLVGLRQHLLEAVVIPRDPHGVVGGGRPRSIPLDFTVDLGR
ncbi:hypothetical protein CV102_18275 [Natronococcus pandeyae]|uniref:Uncharacterized protein n=1 Tax=Natronococcus pandeyae TaxID=2055836 RepID=A0A8J8TR11_9EURY|nr:hypothetical protein [Natronococcus pandeyae]TYL37254.1 hypothetical protein CV102_18275 [Natronococcus pandeyae]